MAAPEDVLHLPAYLLGVGDGGGGVVAEAGAAALGVAARPVVGDQEEDAPAVADHALDVMGDDFAEVRPAEVEHAAQVAEGHDDAGRHARGDGDVDAPVHALHDGDGSGVLGKVTLPRQPGVRAAEGFAVPAGEFEQPGDALGDGPVGNRVHVSSICSTGRFARWRVVSPFNARRRCLPRHRNQIPCSYNKLRIHSFLH
jgi:hypothetical protein